MWFVLQELNYAVSPYSILKSDKIAAQGNCMASSAMELSQALNLLITFF